MAHKIDAGGSGKLQERPDGVFRGERDDGLEVQRSEKWHLSVSVAVGHALTCLSERAHLGSGRTGAAVHSGLNDGEAGRCVNERRPALLRRHGQITAEALLHPALSVSLRTTTVPTAAGLLFPLRQTSLHLLTTSTFGWDMVGHASSLVRGSNRMP